MRLTWKVAIAVSSSSSLIVSSVSFNLLLKPVYFHLRHCSFHLEYLQCLCVSRSFRSLLEHMKYHDDFQYPCVLILSLCHFWISFGWLFSVLIMGHLFLLLCIPAKFLLDLIFLIPGYFWIPINVLELYSEMQFFGNSLSLLGLFKALLGKNSVYRRASFASLGKTLGVPYPSWTSLTMLWGFHSGRWEQELFLVLWCLFPRLGSFFTCMCCDSEGPSVDQNLLSAQLSPVWC